MRVTELPGHLRAVAHLRTGTKWLLGEHPTTCRRLPVHTATAPSLPSWAGFPFCDGWRALPDAFRPSWGLLHAFSSFRAEGVFARSGRPGLAGSSESRLSATHSAPLHPGPGPPPLLSTSRPADQPPAASCRSPPFVGGRGGSGRTSPPGRAPSPRSASPASPRRRTTPPRPPAESRRVFIGERGPLTERGAPLAFCDPVTRWLHARTSRGPGSSTRTARSAPGPPRRTHGPRPLRRRSGRGAAACPRRRSSPATCRRPTRRP